MFARHLPKWRAVRDEPAAASWRCAEPGMGDPGVVWTRWRPARKLPQVASDRAKPGSFWFRLRMCGVVLVVLALNAMWAAGGVAGVRADAGLQGRSEAARAVPRSAAREAR